MKAPSRVIEHSKTRGISDDMKFTKSLSDSELLTQIQNLAAEERKLTMQVLELLREVERRRLYSQQGYSTLFEFAVKALGYSEASAARRINSMRLLKELPEVAASIEKGNLNLSSVSTFHSFLKREERENGKTYTSEEKRELLKKMESRSHRECEKILLTVSPESARPKERLRQISDKESELKFVVSDNLVKKLERLKGLLAHSHPHLNTAQLIEILADRALEELDPIRKAARIAAAKTKRDLKVKQVARSKKSASSETPPPGGADSTPTSESELRPIAAKQNPRSIPVAIRRQVWVRDGGQCTFISPETRIRCTSRYRLEIDHRVSVTLGGGSEAENLRLLCKSHNTWEAIDQLGRSKMAQFIPGLR